MKPPVVKFKGITISYTDTGKGSAIIFLHGFLLSKAVWEPFSKEFSKTNRVITIDLLGHGNTPCLSYVHTMDEMAEAVHAVVKKLKLRKYFLVGHSMGGYVSLALAEKYPDAIRGLCLFHSTAKADSKAKQKERNRAINVVKKNASLFINGAIPRLFNTIHKPHKRGIDKALKIASSTSLQGIIAALEGMKLRLDREIVVKFAPYPVLYIVGKEDVVLKHKMLMKEAKETESAVFMFNDVGHMGFMEAKKQTKEVLRKLIK